MEYKYTKIVVAGIGGVGWPLVVSLCQVLDGSIPIVIYDDDNFEGGRGYTRFPYIHNTKTKKVEFLKAHIEVIWRKPPPAAHSKRLEAENFNGKNWTGSLVVDCTDLDPKRRKSLYDAIIKAGATYMRVSYDGMVANVARGLPLLSTIDQEGPGGYLEPPDLPMSFAAGGFGAKYVLHALETGDIQEGVLTVPIIKEKLHGMDETIGEEMPDSKEHIGNSSNGNLGHSRAGRSRKRKVRVDGPVSGGD